jgi:hypothetical protein
MPTIYEELKHTVASRGAEAALTQLADRLKTEKKYFDLFSARLMQGRQRLGLNVASADGLDDLPEPQRSQMEAVYLDACREVGHLLLAEGQLREAWLYLRPVGDKTPLTQALERMEPQEDKLDEFVQMAVHEGLAPRKGFAAVLSNYGICNAITMFDSTMYDRPLAQRQQVAALLVQSLHGDLLGNLKAEIQRQEGSEPKEKTIAELVADRDWLFLEDAYHIDTSHLHSVVRFARLLTDPESLRLAFDLAEYGRRLSPQYQFQTEEPFAEVYVSQALFFGAQLGRNVDEALKYFGDKARTLDQEEHGIGPAEVYVALLARLGRHADALQAAAELLPRNAPASGFAPSLLELARSAGAYDQLLSVCQSRDDLLSFAAGLVESKQKR